MGTLKNFREKVAQCRKKIKRGDPLVSAGFVGYLEKVKNDRGDPLRSVCLGPFAGLGALGGFRIVSKKWTDQCEDCSLKKKQDGNVPSRRHILGSKIFKEQLLETFGKIIFFKKKLKFFFRKKSIFLESRTMPKNSKRGHSGSLNVFTNRKLQKKMQLIDSENFRKKSRIVPKKTKKIKRNETKLWSRIYFWKHKKFVV